MSDLVMPHFNSEAEEARWWDAHQDEIADEFLASPASESPVRGATAKDMRLPIRVAIDPEDVPVMEQQALEKGISFEEHAARLFHAAVEAEEHRKAS